MKDLIIIGAGPAGITAAVYAARKKLDFAVISRDIGGQTAWSLEVENYTGYQFIPGPELAMKFREHLEKFDFELREGESVKTIEKTGQIFKVTTTKGDVLESKAVIVATGKRPKLLGVPGEGKFKGKGLTYCATCDGPLFTGKNVAVIGGGNSGLDATMQLMRLAKKVYLINSVDKLTGDPIMQERIAQAVNVEVINSAKVLQISGEQFVKALKVEINGQERDLPVEGIFVEIGLVPNSKFVDLAEKNERGEIVVNAAAETSVEGLFAAGDVTNVPEKQIIVAGGEGAKATLTAFKYLSTH
ncbi:MAG: FAD-dependent oxidoreductase [Candidatus Margulisbacteria bacterium]|nr:FAD-dependent oxidoreductase [Candidatus Margulisiibacteriota bacterium]